LRNSIKNLPTTKSLQLRLPSSLPTIHPRLTTKLPSLLPQTISSQSTGLRMKATKRTVPLLDRSLLAHPRAQGFSTGNLMQQGCSLPQNPKIPRRRRRSSSVGNGEHKKRKKKRTTTTSDQTTVKRTKTDGSVHGENLFLKVHVRQALRLGLLALTRLECLVPGPQPHPQAALQLLLAHLTLLHGPMAPGCPMHHPMDGFLAHRLLAGAKYPEMNLFPSTSDSWGNAIRRSQKVLTKRNPGGCLPLRSGFVIRKTGRHEGATFSRAGNLGPMSKRKHLSIVLENTALAGPGYRR
jgi:hypothetical protein